MQKKSGENNGLWVLTGHRVRNCWASTCCCRRKETEEGANHEPKKWSGEPGRFFKVATFCFDDRFEHSWHSRDELQEVVTGNGLPTILKEFPEMLSTCWPFCLPSAIQLTPNHLDWGSGQAQHPIILLLGQIAVTQPGESTDYAVSLTWTFKREKMIPWCKTYKVVLTVLSIAAGYSSCLPLREDPICTAEEIAKYSIVFTGKWSQTSFPKQYPLYRPPAQWSSLLGK
ncbi:unnamed protein product [Ranitomeya imitator]|uniref:Spondin domain-containing protein n=1 Tax=Ranitomeya imitator TaxID=111125 RepID=A0ABN9L8H8_9NEOB|nr:unnamed protein product [Ranitomeya imitator]